MGRPIDDRMSAVRPLYRAGLPEPEIARRVGCSTRAVQYHLEQHATAHDRRRHDAAAPVLARWQRGELASAIAGELGVARSTVYRAVRRAGLEPPNRQRGPDQVALQAHRREIEREQAIMRWRRNGRTLSSIASKLGITKQRVAQIIDRRRRAHVSA